jgi:hypothetical protein
MRDAREKFAAEMADRMRGRGQSAEDEDEGGGGAESAAQFRLVRGNSRIYVRCSPQDSADKCIEAAIVRMDHIAPERREMQAKAAPQRPAPGAPTPPAPQRQ